MRLSPGFILPLLLLAALGDVAAAQGMPTSQPGRLTITIEELKVGMDADHEANESGWPAAFAKANSPFYYLALESMTGTPEVWFVAPYESWAAEERSMKESEENPALAAELKRLWRADGQYLNSTRTVQAVGRPDLSHGQFPDLAFVRYYEITTFRVRPGHEQSFENAARVYLENTKRLAPNASYRMYQVTAGMPGGTYLVFGAAKSYAEFDQQLAEGMAMWEKVSPKDMSTMEQMMVNGAISVTTHRYRVSPTMSYVSADSKAKDRAFWK